jgi:MFS family permease
MTMNFIFSAFALLIIGLLGDLIGLKLTYLITALVSFVSILFIIRLPKEATK